MTATRRTRPAGFARRAAVSFAVGLVMGGVCWALGLTAPAPTLLGLAGLLGVGLGERAATALATRLVRRRTCPEAPQPARPEKAAPQDASVPSRPH
ncbi:DUF1427 family protein [Streptomyces sp. ISL-36]|uniref:DUF1427 family protein n=1 Tax=Streptomyces sp. ISL-36 TaxID=2819182 RepID=UPI001BE9734F|nr:DUF1427 family protein [Streptomyces sp. ISL-36]